MKGHKIVVLAAVLAALTALTSAGAAYACSCVAPPPPKEALAASDAVFTATVLAIDTTQTNRQVRVRVESSWKGAKCGEMTIVTGLNDADCGYDFQVGTSYLIYADRNKGNLTTGICTRTTPTAQASEDLTALGQPKTTCGQG